MSKTSPDTYNYKVVRQFTIMTVIWGIFGVGHPPPFKTGDLFKGFPGVDPPFARILEPPLHFIG